MLGLMVFLSCKEESKIVGATEHTAVAEVVNIESVELEIYDFNGLEKFLNIEDEKVHVVNFWATWCAPCVKELPYFEQLNNNYSDKNVEVLLVSLDFPKQYDKKLKPFIIEHNLQSKILVLDDVNMNTWVPKINKDWDGAIPVTIIYNKDKRQFYSRPFTYDELETEVVKFLN